MHPSWPLTEKVRFVNQSFSHQFWTRNENHRMVASPYCPHITVSTAHVTNPGHCVGHLLLGDVANERPSCGSWREVSRVTAQCPTGQGEDCQEQYDSRHVKHHGRAFWGTDGSKNKERISNSHDDYIPQLQTSGCIAGFRLSSNRHSQTSLTLPSSSTLFPRQQNVLVLPELKFGKLEEKSIIWTSYHEILQIRQNIKQMQVI